MAVRCHSLFLPVLLAASLVASAQLPPTTTPSLSSLGEPRADASRAAGTTESSYRRVLAAWSGSRSQESVEELIRLESRGPVSLATCTELRTVDELSLLEPWSAAAVAALHLETLASYLTASQGDLAEHALGMVERSLFRLARRGGSSEASRAAAAGIGRARAAFGHLRGRQLLARLLESLSLAAKLSPDDPEVLAVAADLWEKLGRYDLAAAALERIESRGSASERARLSTALQRLRLDREPDLAQEALVELARGAEADWLRELAALESGLLPAGLENGGDGPVRLGPALRRISVEGEGSRSRAERARSLLARAAELGPSARALYDLGAIEELDALSGRFEEALERHGESLGRALSRLAPRPSGPTRRALRSCRDLLELE